VIPADLPGWRRPHGAVKPKRSEARAAERKSLCDAIRQLLPGDRAALYAGVLEEWGSCTEVEFSLAFSQLIDDGSVRSIGGELVLTRGDQ
jgi:hypothetical protein